MLDTWYHGHIHKYFFIIHTEIIVKLNRNRRVNTQIKSYAWMQEVQIHFPQMPLTNTRQTSTNANVPDRPMPALQWITTGPTSEDKTPDERTSNRKSKNALGDSGTPKSGQVV